MMSVGRLLKMMRGRSHQRTTPLSQSNPPALQAIQRVSQPPKLKDQTDDLMSLSFAKFADDENRIAPKPGQAWFVSTSVGDND